MPLDPADDGPFALNPPQSIHLKNAPLARVLCQVRWPDLTQLSQNFESISGGIGASLAHAYPLFAVRQESNFVFGPNGISPAPGIAVHQWSTPDSRFQIHFSQTFLTVETQRYTSKEELIGRLEEVLAVISEHLAIPVCTRLGYRYTNRVPADIDIRPLIRAEVRGGEAVPRRPGVDVVQSVAETLYSVDGDHLLARWAQLPAGMTVDPTMPPLATASWTLDLDAYNEDAVPFVAAEIAQTAFRLAVRGYTFFRWSVTNEFLETFGGSN